MSVALVVAVTDNGVIGKDGKRGFYLHSDMRHFRLLTENGCVIMGRKTYESIPDNKRPLPNRLNIVLSRSPKYQPAGATKAESLSEAIDIAKEKGFEQVFIIGGQEVFDEAIKIADRVYLTRIHINISGDKYFNYDFSGWRETLRQKQKAGGKDKYDFDFIELVRD
jgi:dihydrofolate reductase